MDIKDSFDCHIYKELRNEKKNNQLVIFDSNGDPIGQTTNKVVATGKIEQIEALFRQYDISEKHNIVYPRPDNRANPRWISVFGVGSGGAPFSEPNNPYNVLSKDTDLSAPATFKANTTGSKVKYWNNNRKKDFSQIYLNWDDRNEDIYALLLCEIDYTDCLGQTINEIGLYNASHTLNDSDIIVDKTNFSLYAKANFNAIIKSPQANSSSYKIAYKVFV